jgi:hypothetical protein
MGEHVELSPVFGSAPGVGRGSASAGIVVSGHVDDAASMVSEHQNGVKATGEATDCTSEAVKAVQRPPHLSTDP